jgi:hypothetical protein
MVRGIYRLGVAALMVAAMGQAPASAGDDEVRREGSCSNRSDWELRVKRDDGAFRVRWRVDSRIAGQTWRMQVFHNGTQFASGTRTTNADGEATIDRRGVPNFRGPDTFRGTARNPNTGETCAGSLTI